MTYTQGPWHYRFDTGRDTFRVSPDFPSAKIISEDYSYENCAAVKRIPTAEREANARLIASAPDMLAALEAWISWEHGRESYPLPENNPYFVAYKAALNAIQKAKGE